MTTLQMHTFKAVLRARQISPLVMITMDFLEQVSKLVLARARSVRDRMLAVDR